MTLFALFSRRFSLTYVTKLDMYGVLRSVAAIFGGKTVRVAYVNQSLFCRVFHSKSSRFMKRVQPKIYLTTTVEAISMYVSYRTALVSKIAVEPTTLLPPVKRSLSENIRPDVT